MAKDLVKAFLWDFETASMLFLEIAFEVLAKEVESKLPFFSFSTGLSSYSQIDSKVMSISSRSYHFFYFEEKLGTGILLVDVLAKDPVSLWLNLFLV